ncbi:hypothetical protein BST16_28135, partial [Mycobacterium asiaticum DSM 44297]
FALPPLTFPTLPPITFPPFPALPDIGASITGGINALVNLAGSLALPPFALPPLTFPTLPPITFPPFP